MLRKKKTRQRIDGSANPEGPVFGVGQHDIRHGRLMQWQNDLKCTGPPS